MQVYQMSTQKSPRFQDKTLYNTHVFHGNVALILCVDLVECIDYHRTIKHKTRIALELKIIQEGKDRLKCDISTCAWLCLVLYSYSHAPVRPLFAR